MNVSQAAELVRKNMRITYQSSTWEDGYTHVRIEAMIFGRIYEAVGNSKYRMNDKKEGLAFSVTLGVNKAVGRAVAKMAHHVVAVVAEEEAEVEMMTVMPVMVPIV